MQAGVFAPCGLVREVQNRLFEDGLDPHEALYIRFHDRLCPLEPTDDVVVQAQLVQRDKDALEFEEAWRGIVQREVPSDELIRHYVEHSEAILEARLGGGFHVLDSVGIGPEHFHQIVEADRTFHSAVQSR